MSTYLPTEICIKVASQSGPAYWKTWEPQHTVHNVMKLPPTILAPLALLPLLVLREQGLQYGNLPFQLLCLRLLAPWEFFQN